MSLSVQTAVNEIQQELNLIGQKVDSSDIYLYLKRAINYFSTNYALPTSKSQADLLVFNGVLEYELPSDFASVIEPKKPWPTRSPKFANRTSREMLHWPFGERQMSVEYDAGEPFLQVIDTNGVKFALDNCDEDDDVTLTGDGTQLSVDQMYYTEGLGALRFIVTASTGSTILTFDPIDQVDIEEFLTKAKFFLDLFCPDSNTEPITLVTLRLGDDSSNYREFNANTRFRGQDIESGWGIIGFDPSEPARNLLTQDGEFLLTQGGQEILTNGMTGTPDDTAITWMQVEIEHGTTGVDGAYRLDNIFCSQGVYFQLPYYSKNNVVSAAGVETDEITGVGDSITLPRQMNESIIYKALELICASPNVKDFDSAKLFAANCKDKEMALQVQFPVERANRQSTWYKRTSFKGGSRIGLR